MTDRSSWPLMLTTAEVAALCRSQVSTVTRWAVAGKIGRQMPGRTWLFPRAEVEELLGVPPGTPLLPAERAEPATPLARVHRELAGLGREVPDPLPACGPDCTSDCGWCKGTGSPLSARIAERQAPAS